MYQFVDTITENVTTELPSEAMQFNGEYIENQIDGYQTLYVRGRESMLAEINAYETGVRDGTGITSKRFPARELVIGYLLRAETNTAFREAYNALNGILNTQDAQIIFRDEEDKYFTGTPEGLDEIEAGRNFVQGEIIIYCADPFKYGLEEIAAPAVNGSFSITYNGTYKTYPTLEATFNADCGYCAWFIYSDLKNNNKLIQLGNVDETDEGTFTRTETQLSQSMSKLTISGGFVKDNDWDQNVYDIMVNIDQDMWMGMGGTVKYTSPYIYPNEFYNARDGYYWCGISLSCPLGSEGDYATDWKLTWKQRLRISSGNKGNNERGGIQVIVTDASNKVIGAANMYKGAGDTGSTGHITIHTNGNKSAKSNISMAYGNSYWGSSGECTMSKTGNTVAFNLGGLSYSLTDSAITNMEARRVTIVFLQRSVFDVMTEGVSQIKFVKTNIEYTQDVKNSFGDGDTAVADCASGTVLINGARNDSYGNIGNDWEGFCLYPGTQSIGFSYSDWYTASISTRLIYREVFI